MNPLYESFMGSRQGPAAPQNAGFMPQTLLSNLQLLAQQIAPLGMTPEQIVRQKIQNREMTQAQFEQYSQTANFLMNQFRNMGVFR